MYGSQGIWRLKFLQMCRSLASRFEDLDALKAHEKGQLLHEMIEVKIIHIP